MGVGSFRSPTTNSPSPRRWHTCFRASIRTPLLHEVVRSNQVARNRLDSVLVDQRQLCQSQTLAPCTERPLSRCVPEQRKVCRREGFRARQAYERHRGRNPRAAGDATARGILDFRLFRRWRDHRQEAPRWIRLGDFVVPRAVLLVRRAAGRAAFTFDHRRGRVGARSPEAECLRLKVVSCHAGS